MFLSAFVGSSFASAKMKDSPNKNYYVKLAQNAPYYDRPNGKKQGIIKKEFKGKDSEGNEQYMTNSVKVIQYTSEKWVKVQFSNKKSGKSKQIKFIKSDNIRANFYSLDYVIIAPQTGVNLRASNTVKSKILTTIPMGALVEVYYKSNCVESPIKDKWVHVQYIKNNKKYIGYVYEGLVKY
ncbi:SH3 domain-containing protein [Rummeliibacillus pycnus]|uniref:SH3 domain-containing protein n=1 Tax=Rummeliibacillus pycnus TaxID=101070 RepID=UPI001472DE3C|nr:SH3 domain-containing protein [Rummeliibacillus pycnus]